MKTDLFRREAHDPGGFDLDMQTLQATIDTRLQRIARRERVRDLVRAATVGLPAVVLLSLFAIT